MKVNNILHCNCVLVSTKSVVLPCCPFVLINIASIIMHNIVKVHFHVDYIPEYMCQINQNFYELFVYYIKCTIYNTCSPCDMDQRHLTGQ